MCYVSIYFSVIVLCTLHVSNVDLRTELSLSATSLFHHDVTAKHVAVIIFVGIRMICHWVYRTCFSVLETRRTPFTAACMFI